MGRSSLCFGRSVSVVSDADAETDKDVESATVAEVEVAEKATGVFNPKENRTMPSKGRIKREKVMRLDV
jgi:hypothetical protein